jgi:hypothetical protein
LPESLLRQALGSLKRREEQGGKFTWSLVPNSRNPKLPTLVCAFPDESRLIGSFTLRGNQVSKVTVEDTAKRK